MRALLIILALLCSASAGAIELTLVETVQGNVYDADADRVLYSDANQDLRILDRDSRAEAIIDNPYTGNNPDRANLTPRGAIFTARSNATAVTRVFDYAAGNLITLPFIDSALSLVVAGEWAIWNEGPILVRRNLLTGTNRVISEVAGNTDNDVSPASDVAFWSSIDFGLPTQDYNIYLFQNGSTVPVTQDRSLDVFPVTDGTTTVWQHDRTQIFLQGPDGFEVLRGRSSARDEPSSPFDYLVRNGWVAFTEVQDSGLERVVLRNPDGERQPVSDWGNYHLESLSDDGKLTYLKNTTSPQPRFLYAQEFGVSPVNVPGGRGFWVGERFLVARDAELYQSNVPLGPSSRRSVHCLGDIDGNGIVDIAMVGQDRSVMIRSLADLPVGGFSFANLPRVTDVEVMGDINANGAPELVALGTAPMGTEVRDSLTGAELATEVLTRNLEPVDLEIVPDTGNNGVPELASLGRNPQVVQVDDPIQSSPPPAQIAFSPYFDARDLAVYPDVNGDGLPELGVLGNNGGPTQGDKLELRSLTPGAAPVREIYLSKDWRVLQHEPLADINGNGYPEAAIMRVSHSSDLNHVLIRDTGPGKDRLGIVAFDRNFPPLKLMILPDLNGNGADEVAVYARQRLGTSQKIKIKDSKTLMPINTVFFDRNFVGLDATSCPDINGNGADELLLLGERADNGKVRVIVKDSLTDELLGKVNF